MIRRFYTFALSALSLTFLAGCSGGIGQTLGLEGQSAPDEFKIVKHAPLEIPQTLDLPKPQPGKKRPQEITPQQEAQTALFGQNNRQTQSNPERARSTGPSMDDDFMSKLGAGQADQDIRQTLDKEFGKVGQQQVPTIQKLINFGDNQTDPISSVIDAPKEAERLKSQIEKGAPLNEGEVPTKLK